MALQSQQMNWPRAAFMDAWLGTHQPFEPFPADEPHAHEERWEPEQEVTCEIRGGAGRAGAKVTTPTLIVGGTSGYLVQIFSVPNQRFLISLISESG